MDIFLAVDMDALAGQDLHQSVHTVRLAHAVGIQPDKFFLPRRFQPDRFSPWGNFNPGLGQQLQQGIQVGGLLLQCGINRRLKLLPVRGRFVSQPFVVGLAPALGILHDGVSVFDADGIIQPPQGLGAAPKISELPGMVQGRGIENDVVMDMGFVHMSADNESVFALGEPHRQLLPQAVGLLRGNLAGDKGLTYLVGDHIIGSAPPAGLGLILPLGK